jgi:hypothetical protein
MTSYFNSDKDWGHFEEMKIAEQAKVKALFSRLKFAIFGGLILIAPVLIMQLLQDTMTGLLAFSLLVLSVAAIFAMTMKTANSKDVILATAAYAAVLVLFLGTSKSSDTQRLPGSVCASQEPDGHCNYYDQVPGTIAGIVIGANVGAVLFIVIVALFATRTFSLRGFRNRIWPPLETFTKSYGT